MQWLKCEQPFPGQRSFHLKVFVRIEGHTADLSRHPGGLATNVVGNDNYNVTVTICQSAFDDILNGFRHNKRSDGRTDGRTDRRYRDDRLLYIGRISAATPDNQSFRIHGNSRTCTLHTLSLGDHLHRSRREPPFQRPNCQSVCRHRFNRPLHCPHRPYYSQTQKSPAPPIPNTPIIRCTTAHGDHNFCTTRSLSNPQNNTINKWLAWAAYTSLHDR